MIRRMKTFTTYLAEQSLAVNAELDRILPAKDARPARLHETMRYSMFAGGNRFRPILCIAACDACGGSAKQAMAAACALEILHTYTLVHDDLPAMDDDTLRRGQPTNHIAFDEATAILAGDALLTLAFEVLSTDPQSGALCAELARAAGSRGLIGGQAEDLAAEGRVPDADRVDYIHRNKTAALIRAACVMGGLCANADPTSLKHLANFGENIGLAFQLIDDLLDENSTVEELGKDIGSDKERGKMTYLRVHGEQKTEEDARALVQAAKKSLEHLGQDIDILKNLGETLLSRLPA